MRRLLTLALTALLALVLEFTTTPGAMLLRTGP